jgi:co-chaperonin GroES (HSP10)
LAQLKMAHDKDPREEIWSRVGNLESIQVIHPASLLIGIYIPPEKTAGGIILTQKSRDEAKWQGTIGLVLKSGGGAFDDSGDYKFYGASAKIGDWVAFRISDGRRLDVNGYPCVLLEDVRVMLKLSGPDDIY